MRKILFLVILTYSFGFGQAQSNAPVSADFGKLNWLEGSWIRTNPKPGRSGLERWTKVSATEWQGRGINMKGSDTTLVEKLRLVTKDGKIFYVADVPENKSEVYFAFSEISENHFVCENPQHDFPKKIAYWRNGVNLKATISGDGRSIDYFFEKK